MNKNKIKIGVIAGGKSGEHEVSLVSATSVINALDKDKYEIFPIGISKQGKWIVGPNVIKNLKNNYTEQNYYSTLIDHPKLGKGVLSISLKDNNSLNFQPLNIIFPVLHGTYGEDGTIQGLFEMVDIPYVGCGVSTSAIAMDKVIQKELTKSHNLPIVNFLSITAGEWKNQKQEFLKKTKETIKYPLFVKPANLGSSVGISKVKKDSDLEPAIELALKFDNKIIIEEGVNNCREIECAVLGSNNQYFASCCGEVIPSNEFYDFNAKYVDDQSKIIIPAKITPELEKKIRKLAIKAFKMLNGAGLARIDFLLTSDNKIYINELNTMPGFTKISMYPKLWDNSGLPYSELLDRLIQIGFDEHKLKSQLLREFDSQSDWFQK